jgi:predicted acetyltransferase
MNIVEVSPNNLNVYLNLAQSYEGEFSFLTKKQPNDQGLFELDTPIEPPVRGYILYVAATPAGIAAIKEKQSHDYEVCEFYVVPSFRSGSLGEKFAHAIWDKHPGRWEIKQIEGAQYATKFWHKVISRYTHEDFVEDEFLDPYWGRVCRQRFVTG